MDWKTIAGGVISTVIGGLILLLLTRAFDHAVKLKEDHLKRALLVVEGVLFFGAIAWIIAGAWFYNEPSPRAEPLPINMETVLETLAYVFYNRMTPFGHLVMAAGGLAGLVMGIWYPDKLRVMFQSLDGKKPQTPQAIK